MGEFVGKRVVPDHVGVWDQKKTYEPLMIVLDGETGDSYISRKAVPVGVSLADESYWSLCAHYSAQMRKLEQDVDEDVQQMHSDVTAVKNAMSQEFQETHTAISNELDDTHKAISQELSETEQRVNENLEQTSSELTGKVEQAKSDLNTGRQELKDAKDTLNKRMDSIAGGKTSDAEILDARVDADGNTHENLGAHIRSGFESARADQEEAVNRIGRMAAVSDAMRTANMVHTVDFCASNVSGEVKATATSLGHGDRAGVIINGKLKEGADERSTLYFSEPMSFKAGTPYTVFIDETVPKVGYGIYFYEVDTGACLQVGGINRGFTPANTVISTAVFDNGGMFRAGVYSTNCEFENHEIHLYVVEGEYTRKDFYGLLTAVDVPNNAAAIAAVRDDVRKNNLIAMKNVLLNDEAGEPFFTSMPVGVLNFGGTVLNGRLGPTVGTYAVQFSSPFMLEKEKDYTLFVLDEHKDLDYSVYLLDETTWKDVMENGTTRAFNVIHSPCGVIPAHSTGKHQLRIWAQQDTIFENRAVQVYLVEGRYTETELRTYLPAKEASSAMNGLSENLNAVNRVSDTLRRNNLVHTVTCQATGSERSVRLRPVLAFTPARLSAAALARSRGRTRSILVSISGSTRLKPIPSISGLMRKCLNVLCSSTEAAKTAACRWKATTRASAFTISCPKPLLRTRAAITVRVCIPAVIWTSRTMRCTCSFWKVSIPTIRFVVRSSSMTSTTTSRACLRYATACGART